MNTTVVTDTNLAAYLIVKGCILDKMTREEKEVHFHFNTNDKIDALIRGYRYEMAEVPAITFAAVSKELRKNVSEMLEKGVYERH